MERALRARRSVKKLLFRINPIYPVPMKRISLILILAAGSSIAQPLPRIPDADFERVHAMIKPQPGESPWRDVDWLVNITEARKRAVNEDKPLIIFTAADGSPLGRT